MQLKRLFLIGGAFFSKRLPVLRKGLPAQLLLIFSFFLVVGTGAFNVGIIAVDDYYDVLARILQGNKVDHQANIAAAGFRSPIPILLLGTATQTLDAIGIRTPLGQLRLLLVLWGLFSWSMVVASTLGLARLRYSKESHHQWTAHFLVLTYFLIPLFLSRVMVESLSLPFFTLGTSFACRYGLNWRRKDLAWALCLLAIAAVFRPQAGLAAFGLGAFVLFRKRGRDFAYFLFVGAVLFLVTGGLDWIIRGSFHQTLRDYVQYNMAHASSYGTTPFYSYALLFLALSFFPLLISRYRGFQWREEYRFLLPALFIFASFLIGHSLVPHKEERFMIPVLPTFLFLLVPIYTFVFEQAWRRWVFVILNATLLALTCSGVPQNNVIGLVAYLERQTQIETLYNFRNSLVLFPSAFLSRAVTVTAADAVPQRLGCHSAIAVLADERRMHQPEFAGMWCLKRSLPAPLEALVIRLNPARNQRRGTLELWVPPGCPPQG